MKSFCINLDRRADKWVYVREEFARMRIRVTRFTACDMIPGWRGCAISHLILLEQNKNEDKFTIFEDDVQFLHRLELVHLAMLQLPANWDMLFLGINPQELLDRYSNNLFRVNKTCWCMHAYVITNKNGLIDYVLENSSQIGKIDKWFSENVYTNPRFNCFVVYPLICTQIQFQSDTCKRSDASIIAKNYAKYVREQ